MGERGRSIYVFFLSLILFRHYFSSFLFVLLIDKALRGQKDRRMYASVNSMWIWKTEKLKRMEADRKIGNFLYREGRKTTPHSSRLSLGWKWVKSRAWVIAESEWNRVLGWWLRVSKIECLGDGWEWVKSRAWVMAESEWNLELGWWLMCNGLLCCLRRQPTNEQWEQKTSPLIQQIKPLRINHHPSPWIHSLLA